MPGANSDWIVARSQHKRERWAAENISRRGDAYYIPEMRETRHYLVNGRRRREFVTVPVFPSYIFIQSHDGNWFELLRTPGIAGLAHGTGGQPGMISDSRLRLSLRSLEGEDGFIRLPTYGFVNQQPVRITRGAYSGYVGLYQGLSPNERANILLDFMGGKIKHLVRVADLEAA